MKTLLSAATAFVMLCSFATDTAKNWNTKINKNEKESKEGMKTHIVNGDAKLTLFVKKSDVITLTENTPYAGDKNTERHLIVIDNATRKTIYNKGLSNTEINSVDLNVKTDITHGNENIVSFDVIELEVKDGGKVEKKINSYKIN